MNAICSFFRVCPVSFHRTVLVHSSGWDFWAELCPYAEPRCDDMPGPRRSSPPRPVFIKVSVKLKDDAISLSFHVRRRAVVPSLVIGADYEGGARTNTYSLVLSPNCIMSLSLSSKNRLSGTFSLLSNVPLGVSRSSR